MAARKNAQLKPKHTIQEKKQSNGATVVAPIQIDYETKDGTSAIVDIVTSAYGKTLKDDRLIPDYQWFSDRIKDNTVLYVNKRKSTTWFEGGGTARADVQQSKDALLNAILSVDTTKVKTEKDLNVAREQNPAKYSVQEYISADTSLNQIPSIFKRVHWQQRLPKH